MRTIKTFFPWLFIAPSMAAQQAHPQVSDSPFQEYPHFSENPLYAFRQELERNGYTFLDGWEDFLKDKDPYPLAVEIYDFLNDGSSHSFKTICGLFEAVLSHPDGLQIGYALLMVMTQLENNPYIDDLGQEVSKNSSPPKIEQEELKSNIKAHQRKDFELFLAKLLSKIHGFSKNLDHQEEAEKMYRGVFVILSRRMGDLFIINNTSSEKKICNLEAYEATLHRYFKENSPIMHLIKGITLALLATEEENMAEKYLHFLKGHPLNPEVFSHIQYQALKYILCLEGPFETYEAAAKALKNLYANPLFDPPNASNFFILRFLTEHLQGGGFKLYVLQNALDLLCSDFVVNLFKSGLIVDRPLFPSFEDIAPEYEQKHVQQNREMVDKKIPPLHENGFLFHVLASFARFLEIFLSWHLVFSQDPEKELSELDQLTSKEKQLAKALKKAILSHLKSAEGEKDLLSAKKGLEKTMTILEQKTEEGIPPFDLLFPLLIIHQKECSLVAPDVEKKEEVIVPKHLVFSQTIPRFSRFLDQYHSPIHPCAIKMYIDTCALPWQAQEQKAIEELVQKISHKEEGQQAFSWCFPEKSVLGPLEKLLTSTKTQRCIIKKRQDGHYQITPYTSSSPMPKTGTLSSR